MDHFWCDSLWKTHEKKRIKDFVDLSTLDTSLKIKDSYYKIKVSKDLCDCSSSPAVFAQEKYTTRRYLVKIFILTRYRFNKN
jgi:hypothetical protein